MASSAEIWVVTKIAEIAERCGVSPIEAEICFSWINPPGLEEKSYYAMGAVDNTTAGTEEDERKLRRVWTLLGLDNFGSRRFDDLSEVEEAINHALSLAPRARTR